MATNARVRIFDKQGQHVGDPGGDLCGFFNQGDTPLCVTGTGVGHAALAEDLNVSLAGCTPAAGDSFAIMSFNSGAGTFTTHLPPLPPGLDWRVDYAPDSVTLRVVQP